MITEEDKAAIAVILATIKDAWAGGDGKKYAGAFWDDAHYVEATGFRAVGAKAIGERHQRVFDSFFKNSRIDGTYPTEIQELTPDVVIIHSEGNVFFPGESSKGVDPNGLVTMTLLKKGSDWKIAAFQNTPTGKFRKLKFFLRFFRSRTHMRSARYRKPVADQKGRQL